MFDATSALRDEVIIVDDPDEPQSLQEVDVHRLVNGERHKMVPDMATTSCGQEWHAGTDPAVPTASWMAGDPLCWQCFTAHERKRATEHQERERRATNEIVPINLRDWRKK